MKLLTKEIIDAFRKIWCQENSNDPIVQICLFNPTWIGTWYITEYDEENQMFFWLSVLQEKEWWYVSKAEIESFKGRFGLWIERDLHFTPIRFKDLNL
jgi:hypothetical protein